MQELKATANTNSNILYIKHNFTDKLQKKKGQTFDKCKQQLSSSSAFPYYFL